MNVFLIYINFLCLLHYHFKLMEAGLPGQHGVSALKRVEEAPELGREHVLILLLLMVVDNVLVMAPKRTPHVLIIRVQVFDS